MLQITSSIKAEQKTKWLIYCDFSHFTLLILPCSRDNLKRFLCTFLKFVLNVANKQLFDPVD